MTEKMETTIATYDKCADAYAERFMNYPDYQKMMVLFRDKYIKAGDAVLDIGCGPGNNAKIVSETEVTLMGIDLSAEMVEQAKTHVPTGFFRKGDMRRIYETGPFDVVIASFCIVHLQAEEARSLFHRLAALLEPGGVLFLSFMVGKENGFETTRFSDGEEIFFVYHDTDQIKEWLAEVELKVVEHHDQDYTEEDGTITTDTFLFVQKS